MIRQGILKFSISTMLFRSRWCRRLCLFVVLMCYNVSYSRKLPSMVHLRVRREMLLDGCSKVETVLNPLAIQFHRRYAKLTRPWASEIYPNASLYTGANVLYNWEWLKSTYIRGMDVNLSQLLELYDRNNCMFVAWGHAIRNMLLADEMLPIVGELSCSVTRIYKICKRRYGNEVCHVIDNGKAVIVGNVKARKSVTGMKLLEPVRFYAWGTISARPAVERDFTVNMLGIYDNNAGRTYLIDQTGIGFDDACHRQIRPTVTDSSRWLEWAHNDFSRSIGYFEAITFGLITSNKDFENFVSEEIRRHFSRKAFQAFLCESIYEGVFLPRDVPRGIASDTYRGAIGDCASSQERVTEVKERRLAKLRIAVSYAFYEDGAPPGGIYNSMMTAMTSMKFTDSLLDSHLPAGDDSVVAQPTVPSETITFVYSHQSLALPTVVTEARRPVRPSSTLLRPMYADDPVLAPKTPRITPPPLARPPSAEHFRTNAPVILKFSNYDGSEEALIEEEDDVTASAAIDEDEDRLRARLGVPAGHPVKQRPFGLVVFDVTIPFKYPLATHLPLNPNMPIIRL